MSDSVLNGAIESLHADVPAVIPGPTLSYVGDASYKNHSDYFRHNGIKVTFSDIEAAIVAYPYISAAAVAFSEDAAGTRRLVGYIVPNGIFNQIDFTTYLTAKLQAFMIPVVWVYLDQFPLTVSGKIDKNKLYAFHSDELSATKSVAPGNEKEQKLATIIQDLLKLESVSIHADFFRLGGGSLVALRLIAAIRSQFRVNIDIKHFFVYPTIAELARYLNTISNIAGHAYGDPGNKPLAFNSILHGNSIVPIKAGGKKIPLYIVCGGGGSVYTFEKFAHLLDKDQPVYGFQQPSDISELGRFPNTIEEIAAKYVSELLLVNPDGPYALSGHCIGGVIALEMARTLQAMNKKIQLLAMFDVILHKERKKQKALFKPLLRFIIPIKKGSNKLLHKIEFEAFLIARHTKHAFAYKWKNVKSIVHKVHNLQDSEADISVFKKFEKKFMQAFANYKISSYNGNVLVFYAQDRYHFLDTDKNIVFKKHRLTDEVKNRWKNYVSNVKIFDVDGEHSRMFDPVYSKKLALLIQQHLTNEN